MLRCCFSIFYAHPRKEILGNQEEVNTKQGSPYKRSSHVTAPIFQPTVHIDQQDDILETIDSDDSVHIVESRLSKDGSHTATVTPRQRYSGTLGLSASHLPTAHKNLQETSDEQDYEKHDNGDNLETLRRICSEPIGQGTRDDIFLSRYLQWSERRSLRLAQHQELENNMDEEQALQRMKGSVLRAHSSMTFHF